MSGLVRSANDLLALIGHTPTTWNAMTYNEKAKTIYYSAAYAGDFVFFGLFNFGNEIRNKGYALAKKDYRHDTEKRRQRRGEMQAMLERKVADIEFREQEYAEEAAKRMLKRQQARIAAAYEDEWGAGSSGIDWSRPLAPPDPMPAPRKREYENVEWVIERPEKRRKSDDKDPYNNFNTVTVSQNNATMPTRNTTIGQPRVNAILGKFQGTRTKTDVLVPRRSAKNASRKAAIERFFQHRMPLLTLRTYANPPTFSVTAASAQQTVLSTTASNNAADLNMCFPTKEFCWRLCNKMQNDMAVPSGQTPGDGLAEQNPTGIPIIYARNMHRLGVSLLKQTRSYTFMNTVNAVAFLEVYEYVWKGSGDQILDPSGMQIHMDPSDLFYQDVTHGDDPDWNNNITTFPADRDISVNAPGQRPTKHCKLLNKYWRLEKKTKYILAGGNTCTHTVNLPAMYISPDEMQGVSNGDTTNKQYIEGKTRCMMFILHGQMGFEGAAENGAGAGAKVEYMPAALNVRWRQITKARITEHGQRDFIMWTGCHDLVTAGTNEHTALNQPTMLVIDPENVVHVADRDTTAAEGAAPPAGG